MADSESQFQELLAHLVARTSKMLSEHNEMLPLSLALRPSGEVETAVGATDAAGGMPAILNAMQSSLAAAARQESLEAICIAYPNYDDDTIVALLENRENYCATVIIPVLVDPSVRLDMENIEVRDGDIYVFPIAG